MNQSKEEVEMKYIASLITPGDKERRRNRLTLLNKRKKVSFIDKVKRWI